MRPREWLPTVTGSHERPVWLGEVLRFAIGALLNLIVGYGSYLVLLHWLHYVAAYATAYVIGISVSYVFNSLVVFRRPMRARAALSYPLVYIAQFLLGLALMKILIGALHVPAWFGPPLVSAISLPLTFLITRIIVRAG